MNATALQRWQTPHDLLAQTEAAFAKLGEAAIKNRQGKAAREAYILARVGILLNADLARLECHDPPDGLLSFSNIGQVPIEITELLQEGRQRGNENDSDLRIQHQDELDAAVNNNERWLSERIDAKLRDAAKYPQGTILVVYHNTSLYNFDSKRTTAELERASQNAGGNIVAVLIFYEGRLYGKDAMRMLGAA